MSKIGSPAAQKESLGRDVLNALRYYVGGRWGLLGVAATVVAAGLVFNWNWLVAAGLAPLVLMILPCAAMCALGLCMKRQPDQQHSTDAASQKAGDASAESTTVLGSSKKENEHA